jgi:hypothetical protein
MGFVCARRTRPMLLNNADPSLLDPSRWDMEDSILLVEH